MAAELETRIDALLPQTQCTRCGYDGCMPYAQAMARGEAPINRCPPGGARTIDALARLLGVPVQPLDPSCGTEAPSRVALIDEARCIGCARCLEPCPVDAIVGASKHTHTVLEDRCTGCERCLPPCPVDCIVLIDAPFEPLDPDLNRERYHAHRLRLEREERARSAAIEAQKAALRTAMDPPHA
jgi:electron transport complex protein RnfB